MTDGSARPLIIAIDGPAASGKGTLARKLALQFGLAYLDTGLLYRAVGRRLLDQGDPPTDPTAAALAAEALTEADLARDDLRTPPVDAAASLVAAIPAVRAALLGFQRRVGAGRGAALDGRDIGTVIFPDAAVKLFVTASLEARAERRFRELAARGIDTDLARVAGELRARDAADRARQSAPLTAAPDAVTLDTTSLDAEAAFRAACRIVVARLGAAPPSVATRHTRM